MNCGEWGVWTSFNRIDEADAAEAAAVAEAAGYGTFWLGGSPRPAQVRGLLEGSEKLVIGTSIVNIWGYDPEDLAREFHELEADFPGRVCVGIGVGHPEATSDYKRPLRPVEKVLEGGDEGPRPHRFPAGPARPPRATPAAPAFRAPRAPKMLAAPSRRSLGTIPYFTSVD